VPLMLKLLLLVVLLALSWYSWREWRRLKSIERLLVLPECYRLIIAGEAVDFHAERGALVTAHLIVLRLRAERQVLRLPLWQDMVATDDFRRLRVWLRCGE